MRMAGKFRNSYEWIEAFKAPFAAPAVPAALAVPLEVRMRHGALKNLLAGTTFVTRHDPCHALCDQPRLPVAVLRAFSWSYPTGWPGYRPDLPLSSPRTPASPPTHIPPPACNHAVA